MYYKFLSLILKMIREDYNLTQKELSELADKSEIAIRKYEKGENTIPFSVLFMIFKRLELDLIYVRTIAENVLEENKDIFNLQGKKEILKRFNKDISKIYNLDSTKDNIEKWDNLDSNKLLLHKEIKEYIKAYLYIKTDFLDILDFPTLKIQDIQEETTNFLIYNIEKMIKIYESTKEDNEIFSDDYINNIKEKLGFYGEELVKPLSAVEKKVWEIYKETQISKK